MKEGGGAEGECERERALGLPRCHSACVYYCSTYYKAVREEGRGGMEDMCYERLRAEADVN